MFVQHSISIAATLAHLTGKSLDLVAGLVLSVDFILFLTVLFTKATDKLFEDWRLSNSYVEFTSIFTDKTASIIKTSQLKLYKGVMIIFDNCTK